jgi:hypothetical protein
MRPLRRLPRMTTWQRPRLDLKCDQETGQEGQVLDWFGIHEDVKTWG